MKTQEEIEQLAEQYIKDNTGDHYVYCGYVDGYTQCQEDMVDKKYTEDAAWPKYPTRAQQVLIQIAEECFRKYPNNKELYTTDELIDAYKAGVIDGFKEAQNYNSPTKKQDNE